MERRICGIPGIPQSMWSYGRVWIQSERLDCKETGVLLRLRFALLGPTRTRAEEKHKSATAEKRKFPLHAPFHLSSYTHRFTYPITLEQNITNGHSALRTVSFKKLYAPFQCKS